MMDTILKNIITEKDIERQISILQQLLEQPQLTVKTIANQIKTTERTVFSDLQIIRDQLPAGWFIETNSLGIKLIREKDNSTNGLWAIFLPQSVGVRLIKELFFQKEISTIFFTEKNGLSIETLKRHIKKINNHLIPFNIKVKITSNKVTLLGDESAIRIFFHRLLTPLTHNNFFFNDYKIHEGYYTNFLDSLNDSDLAVKTEQLFGACWFFINTIRIKANCRVNHFNFDETDSLFNLYQEKMINLYQREGIYLENEELFFAFFCFLDSWSYNNTYGKKVCFKKDYPELVEVATNLSKQITKHNNLPLNHSYLIDNLVLTLLKYKESALLSEQFQLEYQDLIVTRKENGPFQTDQEILEIINSVIKIKNPSYLLNLISLIEQEARFSSSPEMMTVYFVFQGEPAWKSFLRQELDDLTGRRVNLITTDLQELNKLSFKENDIILSNLSVDINTIPVVYISTVPTKNELRQLTELTLEHYF